MKFRVIPVTIFIMCIALADRGFDMFGISWVQSSSAATAPKDDKIAIKKDSAKKEEGEHGEAKEDEAPKKEEKKSYTMTKPAEAILSYTPGEKEILDKLSARRAELEKWQADLEMKEKLVDVSSQKLDAKLVELKQVKADTEVLLKAYNEHEDAKIRSLVKIYEGMKPKDAAGIMNDLEPEITLEIIDKMSERKASPIIAAMDVKRARKITEDLALKRSLKEAEGKRNLDLSKIDAGAPPANNATNPSNAINVPPLSQ